MTPPLYSSPPDGVMQNWKNFLRAELAPFPGRLDAVIRFGVCIVIAMLLTFFLQIPFLDLAIIVLFFTIMENTVTTYLACILIMLGTLLAAILDNIFLGLTIDYPFWRIFIAGLLVFLGMYCFRVVPIIGNLGYLCALCVIFLQSNMPLLPNGELMLRLNLWSSVVTLYATTLAFITAALIRPSFPSRMMPEEMLRQLGIIARILEDKLNGESADILYPDMVERDLVRLHRMLDQAALENKDFKLQRTRHLARINTLDRLYIAAAQISSLSHETPEQGMNEEPGLSEALKSVKNACLDFMEAIRRNVPFKLNGEIIISDNPQTRGLPLIAELREMRDALQALSSVADTVYPPLKPQKMPLLYPDAATNPAYARFAFKTMLATMLCLGFYKSTQWEGIHTCMLTCILVAQPSLGATARKSFLRIGGCLIGSGLTLLITIVIIPHLQDVTWFILVCLAVLLPAAWIAVGSARSNYAGVQIAFAYALALMASSGPDLDLVEIRDRLLGIIIGVSISTAVHTLIWPEKEEASLRGGMADLLRAIAGMIEAGSLQNLEEKQTSLRDNESAAWNTLANCRELQGRVALEPGGSEEERGFAIQTKKWLDEAQNLLFALHARIASDDHPPPGAAEALRAQADNLSGGGDVPDFRIFAGLKQAEGVSA